MSWIWPLLPAAPVPCSMSRPLLAFLLHLLPVTTEQVSTSCQSYSAFWFSLLKCSPAPIGIAYSLTSLGLYQSTPWTRTSLLTYCKYSFIFSNSSSFINIENLWSNFVCYIMIYLTTNTNIIIITSIERLPYRANKIFAKKKTMGNAATVPQSTNVCIFLQFWKNNISMYIVIFIFTWYTYPTKLKQ